jgi:hypothetical protein
VRFVGAMVRFDTPQYLVMERCRCCRPRLPRAACVYSDPSHCHRVTTAQGKAKQEVEEQDLFPARFHSVTDRMGQNSVALSPLHALPEYEKEGEILVDRCERLYQSFLTVGGKHQ